MKGISVILLATLLSTTAFAAKIAKVDVQKVLSTVNEGKKVRASLKRSSMPSRKSSKKVKKNPQDAAGPAKAICLK